MKAKTSNDSEILVGFYGGAGENSPTDWFLPCLVSEAAGFPSSIMPPSSLEDGAPFSEVSLAAHRVHQIELDPSDIRLIRHLISKVNHRRHLTTIRQAINERLKELNKKKSANYRDVDVSNFNASNVQREGA